MRAEFTKTASLPRPDDARVVAQVSARALLNNYHVIRALACGQAVLPMVKADGYGHGATWAAKCLAREAGVAGFGVATLSEAVALRQGLGLRNRKTRVLLFSGGAPWTQEKGEACEENQITPVISTDADWRTFIKGGWASRLRYELKFNTGMNRLGLSLETVRQIAKDLKSLPSENHPDGICSHLAQGENPEARLSRQQLERFRALRAELATVSPAAQFHLAGSSGIWNAKHWGLDGLTDIVRPGLSLYGVPPWAGAPARGIVPVMRVIAQVIRMEELKAGETIGYGATYSGPDRVAILSAGYADGVHRALSGVGADTGGFAWLAGQATRFAGRVSMDLSAVRATPQAKVGDWAELIGPRVDPWAQAVAAGTIPYELLTSVSARAERVNREEVDFE